MLEEEMMAAADQISGLVSEARARAWYEIRHITSLLTGALAVLPEELPGLGRETTGPDEEPLYI